jgi:hypothetical protein
MQNFTMNELDPWTFSFVAMAFPTEPIDHDNCGAHGAKKSRCSVVMCSQRVKSSLAFAAKLFHITFRYSLEYAHTHSARKTHGVRARQ